MTQVFSPMPAAWSPDCGDGNYRNPVLFADYSDPDVVRHGDDYWMVSSSFCHVPGLPILHSKDLVNWTLANHALPTLVPAEHYSQPRPGCGVWAPSIRFHDGMFWIFYPDPDFGLYVIKAKNPRGRWSAPILVKAGKGLIDPCPLWDDDGKVYLIHGWAKSRAGICNLLTLHQLSSDALSLADEGRVVIDANKMPGWTTLEGPKIYKREGWYYVFAPAGGVREGYQAVFRSRNIEGPYEARNVLDQGGTSVNGPHQGAWVDTPSGEHWFLHFQDMDAFGRVVHLQPMRWTEDAWVGMGVNQNSEGKGEPTLVHKKPALPEQDIAVPATSDDFIAGKMGLQWQWQANPLRSWLGKPGKSQGLKLSCVPLAVEHSHYNAGHLLLQKFPAGVFTVSTCLSLRAKHQGDRAGLMVFGYDYAWLGLQRYESHTQLDFYSCSKANEGGTEMAGFRVEVGVDEVWLRVSVSQNGLCQFSYSVDGVEFHTAGDPFIATQGRWVGAKVGIFASASPGVSKPGSAIFKQFQVGP